MRRIWTIVLGSAVLAACVTPPEARVARDGTDSTAPTFGRLATRPLLREHSSGHDAAARRVIADSATFRSAWDLAFAGRGDTPAPPAVDFTREVVILAAFGTRRSGGYSIDIDSVRVTADAFEVYVRTTSPGPTCGATAALTQPVVMVAAPRSGLPARFHENAQVTNCG